MSFSGNQYPSYANKVITTRGDIVRGSSTGERERLGLGSANQVLQSDGTDIDWETLALADSTLTTQGDVLYQGASGLARLGQSTDGFVLTTKGAAANPVWAAAAGGGAVELLDYEEFSAAAASYTKTFSPALTHDDYGQFMIAISGKTDTENEVPTIIFSGSASNVYASGANISAGGVRTALAVSATAPLLIGNTSTFVSASIPFSCFINFNLNQLGGGGGYLAGHMTTFNVANLMWEEKWFEVASGNLSSVEIEMAGSGQFLQYTRMSIYGAKNA